MNMKTGEPLPTENYADDFTRRFGVQVHDKLQSLTPDMFIEKPIDPEFVSQKIKELLG